MTPAEIVSRIRQMRALAVAIATEKEARDRHDGEKLERLATLCEATSPRLLGMYGNIRPYVAELGRATRRSLDRGLDLDAIMRALLGAEIAAQIHPTLKTPEA